MKLISWNVNGFRAILKKGFLDFVEKEKADVICLQETKVLPEQLEENFKIGDYQLVINPAKKKGYSGTAILTKSKPINITFGIGDPIHDDEGRVITAEFPNYYLVTAYIPNSQRGLLRLNYRMLWDVAFREYLIKLQIKKPIILCGDLNVAHQDIDIANPAANRSNPGFTDSERENFTKLLNSGLVDSFRHFTKQPHRYTWWSNFAGARAKNIGWRIDYHLVSASLMSRVESSRILADVHGSDHCPVSLELNA